VCRKVAGIVPIAAVAAIGVGFEGSSVAATPSDAGADAGDAGLITISGTVNDPIDGPQAGITITLSGSAQAQVVTGFSSGSGPQFSFSVKAGGSYSITAAGTNNFFEPPFQSCLTVTPSIVNLNNLTTSTNIQFVGSGTDSTTNCSPAASMGAGSGSLTLKGNVTSGGLPVAGARVFLNGGTQAFRTTDETGAYSFAVNPGSYACASFSPGVSNLNNLKANTTQNFTGTSCPPAPLVECPTFDALFGLSEPAACATVSTESCGFDRLDSADGWAGDVANDFFNTTETSDCRLGAWNNPPIVNDFTLVGIEQQSLALNLFTLQLFGCAEAGDITGPLSLQVSLIPPDLIRAGLTFTTADISAMEDDYIAAINLALSGQGLSPLTAAETTAFRAQLDFAATKVPGVVSSSTLSFSTCP
jgi:hypothetical protein